KSPIARGRDVVSGAEILGEAFRAFERSRRGGGAERGDAGGFELVDESRDQRRLRPDDDEIDVFFLGESEDRVDIGRRDRHAGRFLGDAGIAWRAIKLVAQRRGGDRPAERMLASARSDHQYAHALSLTSLWSSPLR